MFDLGKSFDHSYVRLLLLCGFVERGDQSGTSGISGREKGTFD